MPRKLQKYANWKKDIWVLETYSLSSPAVRSSSYSSILKANTKPSTAIPHRIFQGTCARLRASKNEVKEPQTNGAINRANEFALMVVALTKARYSGFVALNTKIVICGKPKSYQKWLE